MQAPTMTAAQRKCAHPARSVHPTIDPRWEQCGRCGLVRVAPIAAPWIIAYDAAQPAPEAPSLLALWGLVEEVKPPEEE